MRLHSGLTSKFTNYCFLFSISYYFLNYRSSRIRNNKCFKGFTLLAYHKRRDPKTDRFGVDSAGLWGSTWIFGLEAWRARYSNRILQRTGLETDCHLPTAGSHRTRWVEVCSDDDIFLEKSCKTTTGKIVLPSTKLVYQLIFMLASKHCWPRWLNILFGSRIQ